MSTSISSSNQTIRQGYLTNILMSVGIVASCFLFLASNNRGAATINMSGTLSSHGNAHEPAVAEDQESLGMRTSQRKRMNARRARRTQPGAEINKIGAKNEINKMKLVWFSLGLAILCLVGVFMQMYQPDRAQVVTELRMPKLPKKSLGIATIVTLLAVVVYSVYHKYKLDNTELELAELELGVIDRQIYEMQMKRESSPKRDVFLMRILRDALDEKAEDSESTISWQEFQKFYREFCRVNIMGSWQIADGKYHYQGQPVSAELWGENSQEGILKHFELEFRMK